MDDQLKRRKCDISCIEMGNWLTDLLISSACELLWGQFPTVRAISSIRSTDRGRNFLYYQIEPAVLTANSWVELSGFMSSRKEQC